MEEEEDLSGTGGFMVDSEGEAEFSEDYSACICMQWVHVHFSF